MFTEAKVEVGCPKSWYKREKNVEKSHFSDFFRAPDDSPEANRGTSERKMSKKPIFQTFSERQMIRRRQIVVQAREIYRKIPFFGLFPSARRFARGKLHPFPSYSDSICFCISYSTFFLPLPSLVNFRESNLPSTIDGLDKPIYSLNRVGIFFRVYNL